MKKLLLFTLLVSFTLAPLGAMDDAGSSSSSPNKQPHSHKGLIDDITSDEAGAAEEPARKRYKNVASPLKIAAFRQLVEALIGKFGNHNADKDAFLEEVAKFSTAWESMQERLDESKRQLALAATAPLVSRLLTELRASTEAIRATNIADDAFLPAVEKMCPWYNMLHKMHQNPDDLNSIMEPLRELLWCKLNELVEAACTVHSDAATFFAAETALNFYERIFSIFQGNGARINAITKTIELLYTHLATITVLNLSGHDISDCATTIIFSKMTQLTTLDISKCNLPFLPLLPPSLLHLNAADNNIGSNNTSPLSVEDKTFVSVGGGEEVSLINLRTCNNLQTLNLSNCTLRYIIGVESLTSLDLSRNPLGLNANACEYLNGHDVSLKKLTTLSLREVHLSAVTPDQWIALWQRLTDLTDLNLERSSITDPGTWLGHLPATLQNLNIVRVDLRTVAPKQWSALWQQLTNLTHLNLADSLITAPEKWLGHLPATLQNLNLSTIDLSAVTPEQWIALWLQLTNLTHLNFQWSHITSPESWLGHLPTTLQSLDLARVNLSAVTPAQLIALWQQLTNLTALNFSCSSITNPEAWLEHLPATLQSLNLASANLSAVTPAQLIALWQQLTNLTDLNFSCSSITNPEAWLEHLPATLQSLNLATIDLSAVTTEQWIAIWQRLTNLTDLNSSGSSITNPGAWLEHLPATLQNLDLSTIDLSAVTTEQWIAIWQRLTNLTDLDLWFSRPTNFETWLGQLPPALRQLNLVGVDLSTMTPGARATFLRQHPRLARNPFN